MTELTVDGSALMRGQSVRIHAGGRDLGERVVDDLRQDGAVVWIAFGEAEPRRMFIEEDAARYTAQYGLQREQARKAAFCGLSRVPAEPADAYRGAYGDITDAGQECGGVLTAP